MCIVYSTIYRCWPPSYPGHYYAAAGAAGPSGGGHHLASTPAPSSNKPDPRYSPYPKYVYFSESGNHICMH